MPHPKCVDSSWIYLHEFLFQVLTISPQKKKLRANNLVHDSHEIPKVAPPRVAHQDLGLLWPYRYHLHPRPSGWSWRLLPMEVRNDLTATTAHEACFEHLQHTGAKKCQEINGPMGIEWNTVYKSTENWRTDMIRASNTAKKQGKSYTVPVCLRVQHQIDLSIYNNSSYLPAFVDLAWQFFFFFFPSCCNEKSSTQRCQTKMIYLL